MRLSRVLAECYGKIKYPTKGAALVDVKRINDRNGRRVVAYRCGACHKFHIGGIKPKIEKRNPNVRIVEVVLPKIEEMEFYTTEKL